MVQTQSHRDPTALIVLPDGVRYELPRAGASQRTGGGCLVGFGAIFATFSVFWMVAASGVLGGQTSPSVLFPLFGLPFLFIGIGVILAGLFAAGGSVAVEVRGQRIASVFRLGPLTLRPTSAPIDRIVRLSVRRRERVTSNAPGTAAAFQLCAVLDDGKEVKLAWGERVYLNALARELSGRCDLASPDRLGAENAPEVDEAGIETEALEGTDVGPPPVQPMGSKVVLTHTPDGLSLEIPATGLRGSARGMLIFAVVWMGVTGFVGAMFIMATVGKGQVLPLVPALVIPTFVVIGVAFLVGALAAARRRAIIDVVGGAVLVTQKGLFKVRQWQWEPGALQTVVVGPSGTEVNNRPIMQIHFVPHSGRKTGLFTWREEAELHWIARTLRDAVVHPAAAASRPPSTPA